MAITIGVAEIAVKVLGHLSRLNLFKKKAQKKEQLSRLFSGNWNNLNWINLRPTHYIDYDGWGSGNHFEGRFNVRFSNDQNSWEMFEIKGKRSGKKLKCQIFKNANGIRVFVASGTMEWKKVAMVWTLEERYSNQFPTILVLERGFPKFV